MKCLISGSIQQHGLRALAFAVAIYLLSLNADHVLARDTEYSPQQELVDRACITLNSFLSDRQLTWFQQHIGSAKGIFILPRNIRAGFIIGLEGGTGVLLAKNDRTGEWSYPAFYTMTSLSLGLQAGGEMSEIVLLIMTDSGLDAVLSTSFKLGADATIAAGPAGAGASASMVDIVAFSKSRGIYGGVSLTGAVIKAHDEWNSSYYGEYLRPIDILRRNRVKNPGADRLRQLVKEGSANVPQQTRETVTVKDDGKTTQDMEI